MKNLVVEHKEKIFIQMPKTHAYSILCGINRSNKEGKWKSGKMCTALQPLTPQKRVSIMLIDYISC